MTTENWYSEEDKKSSITVEELELLGQAICDKRGEIDQLSNQKKAMETELLTKELKMVEALSELGRNNFSLASGTSIYINRRVSYTIPKTPEQRTQFFEYLKQKGVFEELITVNHQTLNSFCKAEYDAMIENGQLPLPIPGIADPSTFESIGVRNKK